jgi:hypothetical protein
MSEATVRRYQLKSDPNVIVQAVQFDPNRPWPDGLHPWSGEDFQPRDMSWGYVKGVSGRESISGWLSVCAGDYIVVDAYGDKHVVRPDFFEENYRSVIVINTNPDDYPAVPATPELSTEEQLKQLVRDWRNFLRSTALLGVEKGAIYDADWVELHLRLEIKSKYLLNEG